MEPYPEPPQLPPVVASAGPPAAMRNPVRLLRGVYGDIGAQDLPRWEAGARLSLARCAAACLQVTSARCLSHESAALVHGLWLREREPDVSVVVPSSPHHPHQELPLPPGAQRLAYLRRRHLTLPQKDITTVSGLPVRALGLPAPRIQMAITDVHHSRLYFPDEAWPEYRVLAEFDGRIKYKTPEDLWQEKQRQDALTRMGWRIERFIWADFTHLDLLRDRLLTLFPTTVARSARPVADLWR